MRLLSENFAHNHPIPAECAVGTAQGFGQNRNPHLAWEGAPDGTRSFALTVIDHDVPTVHEMIGRKDMMIPHDQLRTKFVHWTMVDIPPQIHTIPAGSCSNGFIRHGKAHPAGPVGARQGRNDYTAWFANDAEMAGKYHGYDGPYPPSNDMRLHHYVFHLLALDIAHLTLPEHFDDIDILQAASGHILAEAQLVGTYTLNPSLHSST